MMFWIWRIDDFKICGVNRKGESLFLIKLCNLSFMCLSFFLSCVEIFVCLMISCVRIMNLWFKVFIDLWVRFERVIVFWWFLSIVDMILLNFLFMVLIKDDKCWFWWVMVFVSWMLLLFNVCIWCCRVVMLFDVVVLKSDFEIFFMKLKSFCFDFDILIYFLVVGSFVVGISLCIWCIVEFILVIYCICNELRDLIIWLVVLYWGML